MRKSRYSEEQPIDFIKQADAGMPIKEICCYRGSGAAIFYKWSTKCGDMDPPDACRLRKREDESVKLKRPGFEDHLDIHAPASSRLGCKDLLQPNT